METQDYVDGISMEEFSHIQGVLDEEIQEFIRKQQEAKKAGRPGARPYINTIQAIAQRVANRYGIDIQRLNF